MSSELPETNTTTESLFVPYGLTPSGELVKASEAVRGDYSCPGCSSQLTLRDGPQRRKHFAHRKGDGCSQETLLHKTAKMLIAQVVEAHARGEGSGLTLACDCARCSQSFDAPIPESAFDRAAVEARVDKFICDVVAYAKGAPSLAIEILVTHAVEDEKAQELSVPWIELDADSVLQEPTVWRPLRRRTASKLCPDCKEERTRILAIAKKWNLLSQAGPISRTTFLDPDAPYVPALTTCFRCSKEIVVFWWEGVPFYDKEPPEPRPWTVQHRRSNGFGGKYWANTCPCCKVIQGDHFLFRGGDDAAPFRNIPRCRIAPSAPASHSNFKPAPNVRTFIERAFGLR